MMNSPDAQPPRRGFLSRLFGRKPVDPAPPPPPYRPDDVSGHAPSRATEPPPAVAVAPPVAAIPEPEAPPPPPPPVAEVSAAAEPAETAAPPAEAIAPAPVAPGAADAEHLMAGQHALMPAEPAPAETHGVADTPAADAPAVASHAVDSHAAQAPAADAPMSDEAAPAAETLPLEPPAEAAPAPTEVEQTHQELRRLINRRKFEQAAELCETYFGARPDAKDQQGHSIHLKEMIRIELGRGGPDAAQSHAERLRATVRRNDPVVEVLFARHFTESGQLEQAREAWQRVLTVNPNARVARQNLDELNARMAPQG